jgi:hypothetical protein
MLQSLTQMSAQPTSIRSHASGGLSSQQAQISTPLHTAAARSSSGSSTAGKFSRTIGRSGGCLQRRSRRLQALPDGVESARVWYLEQCEKPLFLGVEVVLALGFLALLDGGFSGAYCCCALVCTCTQRPSRAAIYINRPIAKYCKPYCCCTVLYMQSAPFQSCGI